MILLCSLMLAVPVNANLEEKLVCLTFDDGPSGRFTRRLLDGMAERGARATFFLCGYRIELYPELAERILLEGHELGIHGYSHDSMDCMGAADVKREIDSTRVLLPEACKITFLRVPGGRCSDCVQNMARDCGLSILHWSVDPQDWAVRDAQVIEKKVISRVRDGDIILLHDLSDSSVDAAFGIIDALQKEGFQFVTVSEMAAARGVNLISGEIYTHFRKYPVPTENDSEDK